MRGIDDYFSAEHATVRSYSAPNQALYYGKEELRVRACCLYLQDLTCVRRIKGKLFLVEHPRLSLAVDNDFHDSAHKGEYFWLFDDCALRMTITSDRNGYTSLVSRNQRDFKPAA